VRSPPHATPPLPPPRAASRPGREERRRGEMWRQGPGAELLSRRDGDGSMRGGGGGAQRGGAGSMRGGGGAPPSARWRRSPSLGAVAAELEAASDLHPPGPPPFSLNTISYPLCFFPQVAAAVAGW
jgi:hypothetical protein